MKKRFMANHAKSSAAVISLAVHAIIVVAAISFVAVTVHQKTEVQFETKTVKRPKMQLKKLKVPVNVKKKKVLKPKLRKRIMVQPRLKQTMPDIKLPEMIGAKGGAGSVGDGLAGGSGIGFNMPEMNLFGVKTRGEKVFIILDSSDYMMQDNMGGIPAYTIIKSELVRILEGLNPTVLFNIAVYGGGEQMLFPTMTPASPDNVAKVDAWLAPLNRVSKGGKTAYGPKTLGKGGRQITGSFMIDPLKSSPGGWAKPTLMAMQQQADVVFLLTCRWGNELKYKTGTKDRKWDADDQAEYKQNVAKAKALHKKENARRAAKGQPPRVIARGERGLVNAYVKGARLPPSGSTFAKYSPQMMIEAFKNTQLKARKESAIMTSGLASKKPKFSINIIHFVPEGSASGKDPLLSKVATGTRGKYKRIEGMSAIQSYVVADVDE